MIDLDLLARGLGGLGLFLLGMTMLTDGLRQAAGPALQRLLAVATRTRWHGLGSGVLVTAVVQSSTAVTVATIGFVNAGLLTLGAALWVLFGANVGTTMTGWIVAVVGLKFKIEGLALPMVALGVLLRLTGGGTRRAPLGDAVAGFGLLFLGLALLQAVFGGVAAQWRIPAGEGVLALLLQLGVGIAMTLVTQSSSAALAITLVAAQGGLVGTAAAAAVVVGTNIGTTTTALLATLGATPNARRAAWAHVAFNLITAVVALLLLPGMLRALGLLRDTLGLAPGPAIDLALFHTAFNVLGVLLMLPLAAPLARWLGRRFRAAEEDEARPRHLDDNVLAVPALALEALERELDRLGALARATLAAALDGADRAALARRLHSVERLGEAVAGFAERLTRSAMQPGSAQRLAAALRVQRYHAGCAAAAAQAAADGVHDSAAGPAGPAPPEPAAGADEADPADPADQAGTGFVAEAHRVLAHCGEAADAGAREAAWAALEQRYQLRKAALLEAGAQGALPITAMEQALQRASALRRGLEQAVKAARWREAGPAGPLSADRR